MSMKTDRAVSAISFIILFSLSMSVSSATYEFLSYEGSGEFMGSVALDGGIFSSSSYCFSEIYEGSMEASVRGGSVLSEDRLWISGGSGDIVRQFSDQEYSAAYVSGMAGAGVLSGELSANGHEGGTRSEVWLEGDSSGYSNFIYGRDSDYAVERRTSLSGDSNSIDWTSYSSDNISSYISYESLAGSRSDDGYISSFFGSQFSDAFSKNMTIEGDGTEWDFSVDFSGPGTFDIFAAFNDIFNIRGSAVIG